MTRKQIQKDRFDEFIDYIQYIDPANFDLAITWAATGDSGFMACGLGFAPQIFPDLVGYGRGSNQHRFRLRKRNRTVDYMELAQYLFGFTPDESILLFRPYEGIVDEVGEMEPDEILDVMRPRPDCTPQEYYDFLRAYQETLAAFEVGSLPGGRPNWGPVDSGTGQTRSDLFPVLIDGKGLPVQTEKSRESNEEFFARQDFYTERNS